MRERKPFAGKGLAGGVLALVVVGVLAVLGGLGWLWWLGRPVNGVERLRELPLYPGASAIVVRDESVKGEQVAVLTFVAVAKAEDVFAFYDDDLMEHGWQSVGRPSDGGGSGYMKRDGRFEGLEFTGGAGADGGFPWFRVVTNRSPMWLQIDATNKIGQGSGGMETTAVSIQLMEP